CLATTSLPDPCLSTYLSPRFREEPFLWGHRQFFLPIQSHPCRLSPQGRDPSGNIEKFPGQASEL
ncbi:hypothetical protein, partial [Aeromonas sanarellii]